VISLRRFSTVARLFQTIPVKVAEKFEKFGHYGKYCEKQLFEHLFYNRSKKQFTIANKFLLIAMENSKKIHIILWFFLLIIGKTFSVLFSATFFNSAILWPLIFSGHGLFLGASFELFGLKFGHLATVRFRMFSSSSYRKKLQVEADKREL
jgi:hypothetical protein